MESFVRFIAGLVASVAVLSALFAAACGDDEDSQGGRFVVVATTAVLGEFAQQVAGDDAEVQTLIPAGADVHSFELTPAAARSISSADLLLVNGYGLEGGVLEAVVENREGETQVVAASRGLEPLPATDEHSEEEESHEAHGQDNEHVDELTFAEGDPHFWLAVPNAIRYIENIRDALIEADPAHAEGYRARAATAIEELRRLDQEVRRRIQQVPPERRELVVFHDAFGYFAREYGLRLSAAVVPQHGGAEPSASDVSAVVHTVRAEDIPAVYKEPQFSSRAVDTVAAETGARVLTLYSDAFGGNTDTYEKMMRANAEAIVAGLG